MILEQDDVSFAATALAGPLRDLGAANRAQPCEELRLATVAREVLQATRQRGLRRVLGCRRIAAHASEREAIKPRVMIGEKLPKCALVAGEQQRDEALVLYVHDGRVDRHARLMLSQRVSGRTAVIMVLAVRRDHSRGAAASKGRATQFKEPV